MGRLNDGHATLIAFSENSNVLFWEKDVTPPGVDGGGEIDTTTMHNTVWRTKVPKALKTLTDAPFNAAYDTAVYDQIIAMTNINQLITITFSDGSTLAFWGWLNAFQPGALVEGEQPSADITIMASNLNGSEVETGPVQTPA